MAKKKIAALLIAAAVAAGGWALPARVAQQKMTARP